MYEELTDVYLAQHYVMDILGINEKNIKLNTKHMTEIDVLVSLSKLQFSLAKYMRKAENLPWQEKSQMVQQITEDLSGVKQSLLFIQGYMMMTKEELFKSINVVMDRQKSRNKLQDPLGLQKNTEQIVERE